MEKLLPSPSFLLFYNYGVNPFVSLLKSIFTIMSQRGYDEGNNIKYLDKNLSGKSDEIEVKIH